MSVTHRIAHSEVTMSVSEKLTAQAAAALGEPVLAAAMVVPPGATLYRSYAPKSVGDALGGPIVAALRSKAAGAAAGEAGSVPSGQGVLAVTGDRLVYFKKKAIGTGVGERLASWPRSAVSVTYEDNGKWSYPALMLAFGDGSTCVMFGERKWGLDAVGRAASLS